MFSGHPYIWARDSEPIIFLKCQLDSLVFVNNYGAAQQICTVENPCSHICAVIGGMEKCFCPVGLELAAGSTTNCVGETIYYYQVLLV